MSERTEVSFDAALMMALRADAQKELDELPTPAQLKERYPDTSRWDARLQAALHKHRPVLKRVLIAAKSKYVIKSEPQATEKFFGAAVFQKCCRGVGEQPTFAEQIKLYNQMQQKSKRESKRIAIALKIERL